MRMRAVGEVVIRSGGELHGWTSQQGEREREYSRDLGRIEHVEKKCCMYKCRGKIAEQQEVKREDSLTWRKSGEFLFLP